MPNWCDNTLKLSNENKSKIDAVEAELSKKNEDGQLIAELFEYFRPNPMGTWDYGWSVENWGTKWDASIVDWDRTDDENLTIYFETAWGPPLALYEYLISEGWLVEAFYNEPGMCFAGIYDNGADESYEYSDMTPDEIDDELPHELNEMYGISDMKREWEEENEDENE